MGTGLRLSDYMYITLETTLEERPMFSQRMFDLMASFYLLVLLTNNRT